MALMIFFFQAEGGIRDKLVTGVQTCALPIYSSKRFDEFPSIAFDDDKARLDQMAIELQNSPGSTGYIIAYAGRRSRAGEAERMGKRAVDYLTVNRGISRARLVFVNGGYRDADALEPWLVPQGAEPPRPTPTITPGPATPSRRPD